MSTTPESTSGSISLTLWSVGSGGITDLGAVLFGYLVTYPLIFSTIENSTTNQVFEALGPNVPTWRVAGWVFMSAYGMTTRLPGLLGTTSSASLIEGVEVLSSVLYIVSVIVLLIAGVLVAVVGGAPSMRDSVLAGVGTTVGYLVSAFAGIALFTVSVGDAAVSPGLVTLALLAGVTYPAVLGIVGGVAVTALR